MADTTLTVAADTSQATRALRDLSNQFSSLQGVIAGIGFGKLIQDSIDFANSIQQASRATGIAIGTTAAFADAVEEAGGNASEAARDLIDFTRSLDEARQGSSSVQIQLAKVGVSLRDLSILSSQDLFEKTVRGLAAIEDASTRNRLAVQLLGKSFRDIDVRTVAATFAAIPTMDTAAIESAAAAQKNLIKIFNDFRLELLKQLQPISDFVAGLNTTKETIGKVISALVAVTAVLLSFTVIGRVWTALRLAVMLFYDAIIAVVSAIMDLGGFFTAIVRNFSAFITNVQAAGGGLRGLWVVISAVASEIATALAPAIAALEPLWKPLAVAGAAAFGWIKGSVDAMIESIKNGYNAIAAFTGLPQIGDSVGGGRGNAAAEMAQRAKDAEEAERKRAESAKRVVDAQREQALAQKKIVDSYRESNFFSNLQMINERGLVGLNEDRAAKQQKLNEFDLAYTKQIYDLTKQKQELERAAAVGTDEERAKSAAFNKAFPGTLAALNKEYASQRGILSDNIDRLQGAQTIERDRLANLERITAAMDRQVAQAAALKDAQLGIREVTQNISFERSLQGLSPMQKQMRQIGEDNRKAALSAGRAFAAAFEEGGDGLTPERAKQLEKGLQAIADAYEDIADAQRESLSASTELEVGIKEAFKTFIEEAENQANKAKRYFNIFANGFENIFTSMTKGFPGVKRAIKDLANTLVEEFLRIQARNLLASLLGTPGNSVTSGPLGGIGGSVTGVTAGTGLFGFLRGGGGQGGGFLDSIFGSGSGGFSPAVANATGASIFAMGMAAGGPVNPGKALMVGERGPEMFLPMTAGSIIPNNQLGGSGASYVTNVNYAISAVDASSFRSLVAQDPEFIFNITEKGRRGTPTRRLA